MPTKSDVWRAMSERRDGCMEPDATWGVCGITEELHETAFATNRAQRGRLQEARVGAAARWGVGR